MYVYVYSHLTLNRVNGMEGFCANLNSHLLLIGVVLTALIFSFFSPNFRIGGLFSLSDTIQVLHSQSTSFNSCVQCENTHQQ